MNLSDKIKLLEQLSRKAKAAGDINRARKLQDDANTLNLELIATEDIGNKDRI